MGRLSNYIAYVNADPKDLELVEFNMHHLTVTDPIREERARRLKLDRKVAKERENGQLNLFDDM